MIYRKYITFEVMLQVENYLKQLFVQIEISWEETFYLHCVFDGPDIREPIVHLLDNSYLKDYFSPLILHSKH